MPETMLRTLGIDPGSRHTGYGIIQGDARNLQHIAHGTIQVPVHMGHPQRLGVIYQQLIAIIEQYQPESMATEDVFFAKNVKSALRLGEARGAALLAGLAVGDFTDLEQGAKALVALGRNFEPNKDRNSLHQERLAAYQRAVASLAQLDWQKLAD